MTRIESLAATVESQFGSRLRRLSSIESELSCEVAADQLTAVCNELRDTPELAFEQLVDLAAIDFLDYGQGEWRTSDATTTGFSRGVEPVGHVAVAAGRFAVVYHLLSVSRNWRLRLRCYCQGDEPPMLDSVTTVWASANWYEREAFDLFGVMFRGHPDLRRILTDYGFIGHPFRKDFPLIGNVEVRYDPEKRRVIYQPVSIDPRTTVPKVIRHDNRYEPALREVPDRG
jgi:NADH-quinone oxidoreductase subunit C